MDDKATGEIDTWFNKSFSDLKNCVVTTSITHVNLSVVDTDLENKIESKHKEFVLLNHKLNNRNREKVKGTNIGSSFPTTTKYK